MDITLEQVEKVRSCTGVFYQEAKAALLKTNGSVLDAVILLEQEGQSRTNGGSYSTRPHGAPGGGDGNAPHHIQWAPIRAALKSVVRNCLSISLEVWKNGSMTCLIPLIAALILILVTPYTMLALALLGLCRCYRVHISGQGTETWGDRFNQAADQIADTVSDAVSQLRRSRKNPRNRKG